MIVATLSTFTTVYAWRSGLNRAFRYEIVHLRISHIADFFGVYSSIIMQRVERNWSARLPMSDCLHISARGVVGVLQLCQT